jgi:hypothetical protein
MSAPFEPGEHVLLIDQRDRTYLFRLQAGGTYHTHSGTLAHDVLIGQPEGTRTETSGGMVLTAFRPRFADFALKMKRGAQVVYPKDLGPIVTYADVFPGARVLEAGTGSGALTIALCRAVGRDGRIVSYELREEHHVQAVSGTTAASWTSRLPGSPWKPSRASWSRAGSSAPICRPRSRCSSSCSPFRRKGSFISKPSRCCAADGMSPSEACGPITGWWGTRAS